jgi:hypothetical protein
MSFYPTFPSFPRISGYGRPLGPSGQPQGDKTPKPPPAAADDGYGEAASLPIKCADPAVVYRGRCHGQRLPVVLVVHENRGLNPHVATGLTRRITG